MNEEIKEYLSKYPIEMINRFEELRQLILNSIDFEPEEKLWAKLPSFCHGSKFIRLIPFKDHINIEASAVIAHRDELPGFKFTPKGMLQIYSTQDVPTEFLKVVFRETLQPRE